MIPMEVKVDARKHYEIEAVRRIDDNIDLTIRVGECEVVIAVTPDSLIGSEIANAIDEESACEACRGEDTPMGCRECGA